MTSARVATLSIEPPGCNLGVNCSPLVPGAPGPAKCGFYHSDNGSVPAPGQVAANLLTIA